MKVFIKTYGCQMNVRDSEALAGMLTEVPPQIHFDQRRGITLVVGEGDLPDGEAPVTPNGEAPGMPDGEVPEIPDGEF